MKKIIIYLIGIISALSVGAQSRPLGDDHGGHDATGRLRHGHYTGFFIVDKQEHAFALQADFFVLSPDDRTFFPKLNAILKLGLGGYNTKEYVTQAYKNVRYDFDNHILILDEPLSDFVITAQVHNISGRTHMKGSVWIRSAAKQAQFILESDTVDSSALTQPLVSNATAVDSGDDNEDISFVPLLRGQYEGKCEGKSAVLQLQTMKGLRIQDPRSGNFLFDYEVVGQIGYRRTDEHRTAQRPWDVYGSFAGGVYDLFSGKLFFLGPASSTLDCQRTGSKLTCRFLSRDGEIPCSFELTHSSINSKAQSYSRDFHINPSEEQLKDLPPVAPPSSQELARALDGSFVGYLHHELNNHYRCKFFSS